MSKRILIIGFLIFALSMLMVAPSFAAIVATATNNAGVADKVYVTGVEAGDIVKVYPSPFSTAVVLGKATAPTVTGQAYVAVTVTVKQLIPNTAVAPKNVYVGITKKGQTTEGSPRELVNVALEQQTDINDFNGVVNITVTNNGLGVMDTVYITGFIAGDIVRLYDNSTPNVLLTKATASKTGAVTLKYKQLTNPVYYTVARTKPLAGPSTSESDLSNAIVVGGEIQTVITNSAPTVAKEVYPSTPVILNNAAVTDTVYIQGFIAGDIVKLYDTNNVNTAKLLAKATAAKPVTGAVYSSVTLKVKELTAGANIYYTVTRTKPTSGPSLAESAFSAAQVVPAVVQTTAPLAGTISIVNNPLGTSDTVSVSSLIPGDVVRVYASDIDETVIGKATVVKGATSALVKIPQLGTLGDDVYITVTRTKPDSGATLSESNRVAKTYLSE